METMVLGIMGLLAATGVHGDVPLPLTERQARPAPEWVTRGIMYQIQPRAFTPEGTLKAATARLPQLAGLGVDILYLCPVFVSDDAPDLQGWSPRQKKSGMNNPRNPYRIKDYFHVDPEYGTDDDLKVFIAEAHRLGMRVLLDMVYLHCGPNAVFLAQHPDFVQRDAQGKVAVAGWGFPALNFANLELREYLRKNMEYWVREFGADGFRCDVSDGIPLDFWETARERLDRIRPDLCLLAEGTRREDQLKAFDLDYGWGFTWDHAAAIRQQWEKMWNERLCAMRRTEGALTHGAVVWLDNDQPDAILSLLRRTSDEEVLSVVNLSEHAKEVRISFPEPTSWSCDTLIADGAQLRSDNSRLLVQLQGFGYVVAKRQ